MLLVFRVVSLASVTAAAAFPVALFLIARPPAPVVLCAVLAALVIIWRHQANLARLARGEEPRLGEKKR